MFYWLSHSFTRDKLMSSKAQTIRSMDRSIHTIIERLLRLVPHTWTLCHWLQSKMKNQHRVCSTKWDCVSRKARTTFVFGRLKRMPYRNLWWPAAMTHPLFILAHNYVCAYMYMVSMYTQLAVHLGNAPGANCSHWNYCWLALNKAVAEGKSPNMWSMWILTCTQHLCMWLVCTQTVHSVRAHMSHLQ